MSIDERESLVRRGRHRILTVRGPRGALLFRQDVHRAARGPLRPLAVQPLLKVWEDTVAAQRDC